MIRALRSKVNGSVVAARAAFGLAAGILVALLPCETQNAVANGDTRTIQLYHAHTHETITATFLVNGSYDQSVLDKLNWFLRDWRRDEPTKMDPKLFDVIWEVYRESGSQQPVEVMSAYRSPETNAMLRRRSRGVAEHSQHILGKAMDQHYMDVPMSKIRELAMRLQRGGVGFYPTAGTPFVHMDVGGVRHWPRMSYDQLARLFPDGKTVHIPSNGQPLPGYEMARAELESRGGSSYPTVGQLKSKGFFAWLFGGGSDEDEDNAAEGGGGRRAAPPRNARVAVADRGGAAPQYDPSDKDGGARSFLMSQQAQSAAPSAFGKVAARDPMPAPTPAPQADLALAMAMAPDVATAGKAPDAAVLEPTRTVPDLAMPAQTLTTNGLIVPVPPRRPTELAGMNDLPMPPTRPAELSRAIEGPAPTRVARADGIGGLLSGKGALGLPAVITQGGAGAPPQVLAYAGSYDRPSGVRPPPFKVPLPVVRPPDLVGARLDRGNFPSLTSQAKLERTPGSSPLGAALGARAASRAASSAAGPTPLLTSFGARASDLATDRFSGATVKGQERLVNARRAEAPVNRPSTD